MSCGCRCQAILRVATKADLPDPCAPGLCEGQLAIAASDPTVLYMLINDPTATLTCGRGWVPFEVGTVSSRDVLLFSIAADLDGVGSIAGFMSNSASNTLDNPSIDPIQYPYFPSTSGGTLVALRTEVVSGNPAHPVTFTVYVNGVATAMAITYLATESGPKEYVTPLVVAPGGRLDVHVSTDLAGSAVSLEASVALEVLRDVGIPAA